MTFPNQRDWVRDQPRYLVQSVLSIGRVETENPFDITSGSVRPSTPRPPLKQVAPRKPFLPIFTTSKPTVPGYQPKPLPSSPVLGALHATRAVRQYTR